MTKQANVALIEDQEALKKAINAHGKKRTVIDAEAQMLALSAVAVFEKHGNVYYINQLYANLGKGTRHAAMTEWLLQFGGVKANEGENKDVTPFIKDGDKKVDIEGGRRTPWYDMKKSPNPDQVIDLLKLTLAVIKKASKPKEGQQVAHGEMLSKLQALAEEFAGTEEVADASGEPQK